MEPLSIAEVWSEGHVTETDKKEVTSTQSAHQKAEDEETGPESEEPSVENGSVRTLPEAQDTDAPVSPMENGGGVSADDFLNKGDEAESVSVRSLLEPLTPSKVLEGNEAANGPEPKKDISPNCKRDTGEEEEKADGEETSDLIST